MPRPKSLKPKLCRHRASGRAFVLLDGKFVYLGQYGTQEAQDAYDVAVAEWIARGRQAPAAPQAEAVTAGPNVAEVAAAFWTHAKTTYPAPPVTKGKRPAGELGNYWAVLRPLTRLYGKTPAAEFGPLKLKALREEMIRLGWTRKSLNRQIGRVKHVWKWAVEQQMVPASVHHGLSAVAGLRQGRSGAKETSPVKPVPLAQLEATLPFVPAPVAAMIRAQLHTGARPGEVVQMRGRDLDMSADPWLYTPESHKTKHHGHTRVIPIGQRGQEAIRPFLRTDLNAFLFAPDVAVGGGSKARPVGERYTVRSYRQAVARACLKAFPPPAHLAKIKVKFVRSNGKPYTRWERAAEHRARLGEEKWAELRRWRAEHAWHPHQIRHAAATAFRRAGGLEAARAILGHKSMAMTEVYAEQDLEKARKVIGEVG